MEKTDYIKISGLCKEVEESIKEGKEVNFHPLAELYNNVSSYRKCLMEETIQVSILLNKMYQLLPPELRPICIPTGLSSQQLNEVYDRLIELDYIEGSREGFLSIFDPTCPAPYPLIKWKKPGRNKEIDKVSLINFLLLMGGERDLERYAQSFFGVSFSKSTKSRSGMNIDLQELSLLLGIKEE